MSTEFLLQREDHAAALAAVKEHVRNSPGDFRLDEGDELAADDLVEALTIGEWLTEVDGHGDIVRLAYGGDKYPPDASDDDFPMDLLEALAPFVRHGRFFRWTEGDPFVCSHTVGRGRNVYRRLQPGVRLVQLGEPPVARPGEPVDVEFRIDDYGASEGAVVRLESSHSSQARHEFAAHDVPVGGTGRVRLTLEPGAADPVAFSVSLRVDGVDVGDTDLVVRVAPDPAHDMMPEVVARESSLDVGRSRIVPAAGVAAAFEAVRRYAVRHSGLVGAEFLGDAARATDLRTALLAAGIGTEFNDAGDVEGFRFVGDRLPGHERHVYGVFAAMRGLVEQGPWIHLAYAHDPDRWVRLAYSWGTPGRDLWGR